MKRSWRILIVDDDTFLWNWLKDSLSLLDYEVEAAENGLQGIELFQKFTPDLVLMDAMMPIMGGLEACQQIKALPAGKNIPIIMMTGIKEDDETVIQSFDAGCHDFVTKPINLTVLERRIHTILSGILSEEKLALSNRAALESISDQLKITSLVLEKATEAVLITDLGGTIQSVNPAFTTITGYSFKEAVGKKPNILRSEHHEESFYKALWEALFSQGSWRGEMWNRRKNGEAFPVMQNITAIQDKYGEITHFVSIFTDLTNCKKNQDNQDLITTHDPLTGLPDRHLYSEQVKQAALRAGRNGSKVAILLINMNSFRRVNDSMGYLQGDAVLKEIGSRLKGSIKSGDLISRLRGDEFGIVLVEIITLQDVTDTIQKLFQSLSCPFILQEHEIIITASIGVTLFPDDHQDIETLLQKTDRALSQAKEQEGNSFQFFTPDLDSQACQRLSMESNLRKALTNQEFTLFYQPKVDLISKKVVGTEALIRWFQPGRGTVPPVEFIPLAEESGLIIPMGNWILNTACQNAREWIENGACSLQVSVNISSRQFQDPFIIATLQEALEKSGLPASCLELEITESLVMGNVEEAIRILREFKDLGLKISMDDFGTGYSSLSYLKKFPIDILKIDQSFVRDLVHDASDAALVKAIISMGNNLGLTVIAEGVETVEQALFLRQEGCDMAQGYLYSKPIEKNLFAQFFREYNR
ncbi:MAG: EAL domain-containing protein [Magnetococcales bacterium]|nr:EAL domain-containing protein [Magnetococcales bacterium]